MTSWQPILDGELADQARAAIRDIARALANDEGPAPKLTDATLFWAYVASAIDEPWVQAKYDETVEALCRETEQGFYDSSLYHGAAGSGFAIAHVSEPGIVDAALTVLDESIANRLDVETWTGPYDLIDGLVGTGVYLLDRADVSPIANRGLFRLVDHLISAGHEAPDNGGFTWHTRPEHLTEEQRRDAPRGLVNCGLAHGVPAAVWLLARVAERADAEDRHRRTASDSYRWLAAPRLPPTVRSRYPSWIAPDASPFAARTAWCYGDPGVVTVLWDAAGRVGASPDDALELAKAIATRPPGACGVLDAGLCHGAAGLAHLFNRWFQASNDECFRDAARAWFQRTLNHRRSDGIGGFLAWTRDEDEEMHWKPRTSLLEGVSGIGLALLAAIEPVEPAWDRMMLCDLQLS